jgi:limonene-1,2-epoxide hydrolase
MDHGEVARTFFQNWSTSFDGMCAAFREAFAPGCDWDQRPMCRTTGPDSAVRFLRVCRRGMLLETIDVEILSLAVTGNVVHTARIDHLYRADGSHIASPPVAGVLTFADAKIIHWKEYFDPTVLSGKVTLSSVKHIATSLGNRTQRVAPRQNA